MNTSNTSRDSRAETLRERAANPSDWVNITLSGPASAVESMTHLLHRLNVIGASEWSPIVALRDSQIVMRVASRGMRAMPPDQRPAP